MFGPLPCGEARRTARVAVSKSETARWDMCRTFTVYPALKSFDSGFVSSCRKTPRLFLEDLLVLLDGEGVRIGEDNQNFA